MNKLDELIKAIERIEARCARIETRLCTIGDQLGIPVGAPTRPNKEVHHERTQTEPEPVGRKW